MTLVQVFFWGAYDSKKYGYFNYQFFTYLAFAQFCNAFFSSRYATTRQGEYCWVQVGGFQPPTD